MKRKKENCDMYVYNIALRRGDGKIEQDTIFRRELFTAEDVKQIAEKYACGVLISCSGRYWQADENFVNENSFFVDLPEAKEIVENGQEM